jgi:flagella basal body P-ring formation protein FlgA
MAPAHVAAVAAPTVVVKEAAPLVVKAGETVRVWSWDGMVKMETTGVAQVGGELGKRIRVRLMRQGMESAGTEIFVTGMVSGLGSVEMGR